MSIPEVGVRLSVEELTEAPGHFCDMSPMSIMLMTKKLSLFVQRKVIIFCPWEFRNLKNSVQRS